LVLQLTIGIGHKTLDEATQNNTIARGHNVQATFSVVTLAAMMVVEAIKTSSAFIFIFKLSCDYR